MLVNNLMAHATSVGVGPVGHPNGDNTIQAVVTGTGAVAATVEIDVSLDQQNWLPLRTITLAGTNVATDGFAFLAKWVFIRANLISISGTSASVTVNMGGL